jgi:hypothetical protein
MTRDRSKRDAVPPERIETLRQRIRALLAGPPLTFKEISA